LGGSSPAFTVVASALLAAAAIGLPVALGLAIFKHRLYDIDLLINRALVYGALTSTLALVYFGIDRAPHAGAAASAYPTRPGAGSAQRLVALA